MTQFHTKMQQHYVLPIILRQTTILGGSKGSPRFYSDDMKTDLPSVLWRCWLGGRKGIRPVKTELWGAGVVTYLQRGADLHMAQLMPLPLTVSCFSKIQIGFTFLVQADPGSPGQRAVKRVCVCVMWRQNNNNNNNNNDRLTAFDPGQPG